MPKLPKCPKVVRCALCGESAHFPQCRCCCRCSNDACPQGQEVLLAKRWNAIQRAICAAIAAKGKVVATGSCCFKGKRPIGVCLDVNETWCPFAIDKKQPDCRRVVVMENAGEK